MSDLQIYPDNGIRLSTLGGIPYAVAYCQACFDLQGNRDLLDIL